jgi:hypothetical protein
LLIPTFAAADAPVASDPVFTALMVNAESVSGRIRQFGPKGELTLVTVDGPERVIPIDSLVKLSREVKRTREEDPASLTRRPGVVLFPDGDRLFRASILAANETALEVKPDNMEIVAIPLESLLGLIFHEPTTPEALGLPIGPDALEGLVQRVRNDPRMSEVVWLNNGDKLSGGFLSLTEKAIEIQPGKDRVSVDLSSVVALGFDPSLVVYPKPEGPLLELTFENGSRLGVTGARIEEGNLLARTRFGTSIRAPISDLTRVHARTHSVVYLTEREPAGERYVPYVGPPRPYRRDATVDGHPMLLSGKEYERGIGTQSRTLLAYRLEPGDKRFQAMLGLDDRAGPLGGVIFRVLVDDKERYVSPPMAAHDAPRPVDLDVSGAHVLILITEYGERGGVRDLADWVEARIIR